MAKGTPNPVVNLSRSTGATELHIPSLTNTVVKMSYSATADTQALPAIMVPGRLVRISCTTDCYIRYDSSAVAATDTDTLLIRGVEPHRIPEAATHVSTVRETTNGVATLTQYA